MKKVLIVEDESPAAERLKKLVLGLGDVEILDVLDSIEDTVDWLNSNPAPDIAFFDIQLADGKSFTIFERVEVSCPIIFTTAFDEYAIKAFKVNSVDYLLKPIDEKELRNAWKKFEKLSQPKAPATYDWLGDELKSMLQKENYKSRFLIKSGDQFKFINADKVAYFFSDTGNTFLVDDSGNQYLLDEKLEALEGQLDPDDFHRINRKFIVSCDSIVKISSYFNSRLILELSPSSSTEVIVSRERVGDFKAWLDH